MKRQIVAIASAVALLVSMTAVCATAQAARTIRLSFTVASGSTWDMGAQKFKALVEERSQGKMKVEVYPNGMLVSGNDRVEMEMTQAGAVDIALKSNIWLTQLDKRFYATTLPFLFRDADMAIKVLEGPVGQMITRDLEAKTGMKILAWGDGSFFQVYTNKGPVTTPADLKGVKLRVPGNEVFLSAFRSMDAVPVSMSFGEVFPALQSGAIDGGASPIPLIYSSKFYEVSKYIAINNMVFEGIGVVVGAPFWSSLNADEQALISKAAVDAMAYQREQAASTDDKLIADMRAKGVTIVELTPEQIAAFKGSVKAVYDAAPKAYGEEFVKPLFEEVARLSR